MKKVIFTLTALTLFLSAFTTNNTMVTEKKKSNNVRTNGGTYSKRAATFLG